MYINALISDWNYCLSNYISSLDADERAMKYVWDQKLKPSGYYWRLDVWSIKNIIRDPFLIEDVYNHIKMRYIK
jgi:hypothetical protein